MPYFPVDLHMHTYFSDGRFSPEAVVKHAVSIGLKVMAITDHDNVRGTLEAKPLAEDEGITLIPGVEFTTRWEYAGQESDLDLLAYFIDTNDSDFQQTLAASLTDMQERVADCCVSLTQAGFPVSMGDVYLENPRFAGPGELVRALVSLGLSRDMPRAIHLFNQHWMRVRLSKRHAGSIIEAVHQAGGITVLAHPRRIACIGGQLEAPHVEALRKLGLDGIEVFHPSADASVREELSSLAAAYGMVISGGSDEHATRGRFTRMGTQPIGEEIVQALFERSAQYG